MIAQVRNISGKSIKMQLLGAILIGLFISFILGSVIVKAGNTQAYLDQDKYFTNVTVVEGDSLWDIAEDYMDNSHYSSIYSYIDELKKMNHLTSDDLYTGQNLIVTYFAEEPNQ